MVANRLVEEKVLDLDQMKIVEFPVSEA